MGVARSAIETVRHVTPHPGNQVDNRVKWHSSGMPRTYPAMWQGTGFCSSSYCYPSRMWLNNLLLMVQGHQRWLDYASGILSN